MAGLLMKAPARWRSNVLATSRLAAKHTATNVTAMSGPATQCPARGDTTRTGPALMEPAISKMTAVSWPGLAARLECTRRNWPRHSENGGPRHLADDGHSAAHIQVPQTHFHTQFAVAVGLYFAQYQRYLGQTN